MLWSTLISLLEVKRTCIVLVVRAVTVTWDWLLIWLPPMISWICIKLNRSCLRKSSQFLRRLIENYIAFNSLGGWFRWIWGFFICDVVLCMVVWIDCEQIPFFFFMISFQFFFLLFNFYSCSSNSFFLFSFFAFECCILLFILYINKIIVFLLILLFLFAFYRLVWVGMNIRMYSIYILAIFIVSICSFIGLCDCTE